jgi:hypothetical protein
VNDLGGPDLKENMSAIPNAGRSGGHTKEIGSNAMLRFC